MSDDTKIEWADATWNPVTGCTKVSPGCDNCYAETFAERWRGTPGHHFENGFDVTLRPERLDEPLRWRRPRRVFVNSMSDLFHERVPDEYIARVWQRMASCPQHQFLVLTKRHARMRAWVNRCKESPGGWLTHDGTDPARVTRGTGVIVGHRYIAPRPEYYRNGLRAGQRKPDPLPTVAYGWPLPNVWLGVSIEDQHWADIRVHALLATPAAVRFVSAEPLLGPIDLRNLRAGNGALIDALNGDVKSPAGEIYAACPGSLGWVITGGESGKGARRCELGWIEDIVNACHETRVPVFVKQFGSVLGREFGAGPKGGDIERWPAYLQHRHFPRAAEAVPA